jgi:hypothetical protein
MSRRAGLALVAVLPFLVFAVPSPEITPAQVRTLSPTDRPSYFPLEVGDQWSYARRGPAGSDSWRSAVADRVVQANGRIYYALDGYFGPRRLVRATLRGTVTEYDPNAWADHLWYLLGAPVGSSWRIELQALPLANPLPDCVSGSKVTLASRTDTVTVPAGTFHDVVRLQFASPCADAGIVTEWFAPGVGLIRREEDSFAGPVVSELLHAILAGQVLPRQAYATSLDLDRPIYVNNLMPVVGPDALPMVHGVLTVRNGTPLAIGFTFSGCVSASIEVLDAGGSTVLKTRADDGGCCLCLNLLDVSLANDMLVLPLSFRLQTDDGRPLPDGRYAVRATLNALGTPELRPAATAAIEVRSVY